MSQERPVAATWVRLCTLDELPQPGARGFDVQGGGSDDLFIVRRGALLRAYRNSCPHWPGASLPWRKHAYLDGAAEHIVCHGHGARFTLEDGVCVRGPCQGQSLEPVPLRMEEGRHISALVPSSWVAISRAAATFRVTRTDKPVISSPLIVDWLTNARRRGCDK